MSSIRKEIGHIGLTNGSTDGNYFKEEFLNSNASSHAVLQSSVKTRPLPSRALTQSTRRNCSMPGVKAIQVQHREASRARSQWPHRAYKSTPGYTERVPWWTILLENHQVSNDDNLTSICAAISVWTSSKSGEFFFVFFFVKSNLEKLPVVSWVSHWVALQS